MSDQQQPSARWQRGLSRPFAFDPNSTTNEGRWRLYPPDAIEEHTYWRSDKAGTRSINVVDEVPVTPGVSYVRGQANTGGFIVQAIRFDKAKFTEAQAKVWWARHRDKFRFADELDQGAGTRPSAENIQKVREALRTLAGGLSVWNRRLAPTRESRNREPRKERTANR